MKKIKKRKIKSERLIDDEVITLHKSKENQCLIELIKGKTGKEIAKKLHISPRTVESYLENVKGNLGCRNKSELVEKIYQKGLASLSEEPTTSEPFKSGLFLPVEIKIK